MMDKMQQEVRLCMSCGRELKAGAHRAIGLCLWCVAEEQEPKTIVRGQRYGRDKRDEAGEQSGWG